MLTPCDDEGTWRERVTVSPTASTLGDPPISPLTATEQEQHQQVMQQLPLGTPFLRRGPSTTLDTVATAQRGGAAVEGAAGSSNAPSAAVAANQARLRQIQDSMMDDVINGLLDTLVDEIQLEYLLGDDDDGEGSDGEQTA